MQNQNLVDANLKLKEINILKANFTAMLVHDLRSPLTVVGLVLETVKEGRAPRAPLLDQAEDSLHPRCRKLLEEMLEIYRSEHGQLPLEFSEFHPAPWLSGSADQYHLRAASRRGIPGCRPCPENLPGHHRRPPKLDRALMNLVDNAFKFTPRGGAVRVEAGIEFGSGVEAGLRFLRLSVIDTGRGIPAEDLPFIFDPFRQTERSDASKGRGPGPRHRPAPGGRPPGPDPRPEPGGLRLELQHPPPLLTAAPAEGTIGGSLEPPCASSPPSFSVCPFWPRPSPPLQERADRFLKLVNAGYQSLYYVQPGGHVGRLHGREARA